METNFIARIRAVLARAQMGSFRDQNPPGLQARRFVTTAELNKFLLRSSRLELVFIAYQDQTGKSWFSVSQGEYKQRDRYPDPVDGTLIVVDEKLFDGQKPRLITRLQRHIQMGDHVFRMDGSQIQHWQWIFDRTVCMLNSDYSLRREYLQEMAMQAVHFSLKHITVMNIMLSTYYPIKVAISDDGLPEAYLAKFNEALTLSAN